MVVSLVSQAPHKGSHSMAERPRVDLVSIVARIKRGPVDEDDAAEAEVAVDVLDFLDHACKATVAANRAGRRN